MNTSFWEDSIDDRPTVLVQRTLRSGQNINYDGNVVVVGDVNPGAEIIASGHVLVLGSLRGLVHAGATGDEKASVTALFLNPTQLRIASHITRPPDNTAQLPAEDRAEIARIRHNEVVIEKYQSSQGILD